MNMTCPLCKRSNIIFSDHHIVPKARGGKETVTICTSCHDCIHSLLSNKQLESQYNSVDALMGHETLAKTIKFISKQQGYVRTRLANNQRRRGRNG